MLRLIFKPWMIWTTATLVASIVLAMGLSVESEPNEFGSVYLPGRTTNGHHQIQEKCSACHSSNGDVNEQSCLDCHQQALSEFKDTHPKAKFKDPTRLVLLESIDATKCLTCHREHDGPRTREMGLTVPDDFCWHCHKDVAKDRPSHTDFKFNSCLNAGCHNFHDNSALYENFLEKHLNEPANLVEQLVQHRSQAEPSGPKSLKSEDADAPAEKLSDNQLLRDWAETAHAHVGVNCQGCHLTQKDDESKVWNDAVTLETCARCHKSEAMTFTEGKHGMRVAAGLPEMTPGLARLPMHSEASHRQLNCSACHVGHRFDTRYAAVEACLQCHNDEHSRAFKNSSHFELWTSELTGDLPPGSGVSCATCHMPRQTSASGAVRVMHNQNWNLQPNEKMARSVCMDCHGLGFTLDSLASEALIENCFSTTPETKVDSLELVREWFEKKRK